MTDKGEAPILESKEFEVVDKVVQKDEATLAKRSLKSSAIKSGEEMANDDNSQGGNSRESKIKSTEKVGSGDNVNKDNQISGNKNSKKAATKMDVQQSRNVSEVNLQQRQQQRIPKPIDFTADISLEQLNAPGEYMTDEEIMNHLDEIENIVLDGTSFELQDDVDQSNTTSNMSETHLENQETEGESAFNVETKPPEEVKNNSEEKDAEENPSEVTTKKEEEKSEAPKIEAKATDTDWYETKLEKKVVTVKDRLSKLARVLELTYPRYKGWLDRNEAITGTPICRLDEPRRCPLEKPHCNRWKFVCNRKPVQESTETQNTNKETNTGNSASTMWRLTPTGVWDSNTDNSTEYPPFVMKAVKVFEDFLQTTPFVDEPSSQPASEAASENNEPVKSEESSSRSNTVDKENGKQQWLWVLVRCNRMDELMLFATGRNINRTTMDNLKQVYEDGPGKDCRVKSLYCKSLIKAGSATSNTTTFLVGSEALDEIVGGIKIQLAPKTNFWSNAAGAESLGKAVADLLAPTLKTTVVEIGCGTGLIGLMLASKCHQVIGLDSPSEVEEAEMTSELNGVKNASFVTGEPITVMATIAKILSNCKAVAIVNTNTNIGRAIEVMTDLRKILSLKRLVMVTTLTKQSVRSILELTRPGDQILGNPFIPTRACVVDTLPVGPHFEVVILMERRIINKFPRRWVNASNTAIAQQSISQAEKGVVTSSDQGAGTVSKKEKITLNKVPKPVEPPVRKNINKSEPLPKKAKLGPGLSKKAQFLASKKIKGVQPPPSAKNKFKMKRFHSPERSYVPSKKFANRFEKGNFKPWAVHKSSPEHKVHEDKRALNKFDDIGRKYVSYRNRSPIFKDEMERRKSRSWSEENPMHRESPNREKSFRDHKDQSDLRERLLGNRIEPEILEKVKKQQQMLDMAKQKLSEPSSTVDVATAKQLQNMLNMVLEQTNKLQSQLPRSVWSRIAPPENVTSSSTIQSQNDSLLKGRYVQERGIQDIVITTTNREFMKPNEQTSRGSYDRFNAIPPSRNTVLSSSTRQESSGDRFQNMMPDSRYHGHNIDYHTQQEQNNQWNRDKQLDKNRWEQFPQHKKSSSPIRKAMSPPRHHMSVSTRRGISPPRRPTSPPRRPLSPQRRHISPPRRQMSPLRHQTSSPRPQISSSNVVRRQMSPSRRMSPSRHHISPSRRHLSPARHQLSPLRRVDDDWDIPSRGAVEQNAWQRPAERIPEKRWHEDRQPSTVSSWDHSVNNERYRKSVNQDKWDIKDSSHDAIWNSNTGSGETWESKQTTIAPNKEHWQPAPENRWPNSSGGSNGDNWNIRGKESFAKPSVREESKSSWVDQSNKPRWGESMGSTKDTWGQGDKEDWNDLPDDAKDPWGDDGNNISKDRWQKYDNNPGPSSGWSRENQPTDTWTKPNDNWQTKSATVNKPQWQMSPISQGMNESRWTSNEGTKKASISGGWPENTSTNNSWSSQNHSGFQQSRSYNLGSFKDRR